ncbi:MAG: type II toxin-antitoxin system Phd/YefM family antitoxin [Chloroflexi bacterium]|nr:type II toxin-antitoxin system Phd/YefM family antitoxin [Chloroflexota bacterium]
MVKKVSASAAKAQLAELVLGVAYRGDRVVIERRGKPVAALVSVEDLERLEQTQPTAASQRGALAILGLWKDWPKEELDALVADIYAERDRDTGRPVDMKDL